MEPFFPLPLSRARQEGFREKRSQSLASAGKFTDTSLCERVVGKMHPMAELNHG